jgi:protocatechuate 3,4-dioxygenase beta subunit
MDAGAPHMNLTSPLPADAGPENLTGRRGLLGAALGGAALAGCASRGRPVTADAGPEASLDRLVAGAPSCRVAPTETEGPFPLRAMLAGDALLRADISEGRPGVPLALRIRLVDVTRGCRPLAGAWVYVWHCDRDGQYSGYDGMNEPSPSPTTFLRGIQKSDADGCVTFRTLYPGWYEGRITHIHCMVFLAAAPLTGASPSQATTQFAFPADATAAVYASRLYRKGPNTSVLRLEDDNVFGDGAVSEMLTLTGSVDAGFAAGIVVGVDPSAANPVMAGGAPGGMPPPGGPPRPPRMGFGAPPRGRGGPP